MIDFKDPYIIVIIILIVILLVLIVLCFTNNSSIDNSSIDNTINEEQFENTNKQLSSDDAALINSAWVIPPYNYGAFDSSWNAPYPQYNLLTADATGDIGIVSGQDFTQTLYDKSYMFWAALSNIYGSLNGNTNRHPIGIINRLNEIHKAVEQIQFYLWGDNKQPRDTYGDLEDRLTTILGIKGRGINSINGGRLRLWPVNWNNNDVPTEVTGKHLGILTGNTKIKIMAPPPVGDSQQYDLPLKRAEGTATANFTISNRTSRNDLYLQLI